MGHKHTPVRLTENDTGQVYWVLPSNRSVGSSGGIFWPQAAIRVSPHPQTLCKQTVSLLVSIKAFVLTRVIVSQENHVVKALVWVMI